MKKLSTLTVLAMTGLLVIAWASLAVATDVPSTAVVNERVFNDCPISILAVDNSYPTITIHDTKSNCGAGFANRHNWRFSDDGATNRLFNNIDGFRHSSTMTITGSGDCEAGIGISPWWSQDVDGVFNVRTTDGEVACFGGRLPFYSFTGNNGVVYAKGEAIFLQISYLPNQLSEAEPGTVEYTLEYQGATHTSGPLSFDMGNPDEDPPYGLWGILNEYAAGGYLQFFIGQGAADADANVTWEGIVFEDLGSVVAIESSSWGDVKALYR